MQNELQKMCIRDRKDAVEFASSRELFNGVGNDAFGPDRSMTRGMVSTVLARLAGADTAGGERCV